MKHFWEQSVGKYIARPLWAPIFVWCEDCIWQKMNSVGWDYSYVCLENCQNLAKFQTFEKIIATRCLQDSF